MTKKLLTLLLAFVFSSVLIVLDATPTNAATYSYSIGKYDSSKNNISPMMVSGYNQTHGFEQALASSIRTTGSGSDKNFYIDYVLPDDGSTWSVVGIWSRCYNRSDGIGDDEPTYLYYGTFSETRATPGTFTGVSIGQAVSAANNASTYASQAKSSADNARAQAAAANTAATNAASNTEDAQGTVIEGIRELATLNTNILSSVNNITNYIAPQITEVYNAPIG